MMVMKCNAEAADKHSALFASQDCNQYHSGMPDFLFFSLSVSQWERSSCARRLRPFAPGRRSVSLLAAGQAWARHQIIQKPLAPLSSAEVNSPLYGLLDQCIAPSPEISFADTDRPSRVGLEGLEAVQQHNISQLGETKRPVSRLGRGKDPLSLSAKAAARSCLCLRCLIIAVPDASRGEDQVRRRGPRRPRRRAPASISSAFRHLTTSGRRFVKSHDKREIALSGSLNSA